MKAINRNQMFSMWVLGIVLVIFISTCAFAAPHKHSGKRTTLAAVTAPMETSGGSLHRWEIIGLKYGSLLFALAIFAHFELTSRARWKHALALDEHDQKATASLRAKDAEVSKARLFAEECRKQCEAWKREAEKPRNTYTPAELRKILG
jgi:hypothetical protein